jgi:hypothetical protein
VTAGTAGLSVLAMFGLAFVLCVLITFVSILFQRAQDRRFARPVERSWLATWWRMIRNK